MEQEKEKKKNLSKEEIKAIQKKANKTFFITFAVFMAIILIVGIVFGVIFPQLNKKEIETSAQAENENKQEENTIKEEKVNTIPDYMELSNTSFTGATFKKTWSELEKEINTYYNENYKDSITVIKGNKVELEHTNDVEYSIFKYYKFRNPTLQESAIGLTAGSDNVAYISANVNRTNNNIMSLTYTWSTKVNLEDYLKDLPFILDSVSEKANLRNKTLEFIEQIYSAKEQGKDINDINVCTYYKDNIFIFTNGNQNQTNIVICAATEEEVKYFKENKKWRENITNQTVTSQTSYNTDTSTTSENYYEHPQEWYEEQERLYADNTPSTTQPSSSSSQSSSNKGTSTSSSNNSNKTESEYFKVTANINMKQLIQNNSTAKRVVDNVKEFPIIHLSISDGAGNTGLIYEPLNRIDYSEGRQSIPDTITRNISTKAGAKVKFTIKMSSSSAESSSNDVVITLLEKEMTFDKTGTYEIE